MSHPHLSPAPAPVPTTPLDDKDLLQEILLRLPPQPSSLPRASLVCPRWRSILSDPKFLQCFRKHHLKPPLLGFFKGSPNTKHVFTPVLDPPDRIPAARFPVPLLDNEHWDFMGCRHGLAVLINSWKREIAVWDPLTGQQHRVTSPLGMNNTLRGDYHTWDVAVLCADAEDGHVHGDCFSSHFKLVLVCVGYTQAFGSLYDSASGVWGDISSTAATYKFFSIKTSILVGNALFWLSSGGDVLVFDFETQSLRVIEKLESEHVFDQWRFQLLRMKDGGLGLAVSSKQTIQLWERKSNSDGVAEWAPLQKTIPLESLFARTMHNDHKIVVFMGYDEETNVIVLSTMVGVFMLQLDLMQIKQIIERKDICYLTFHPYTNFYAGGVAGGDGEAENEDIADRFMRYLLSQT